MYRSKLFYLMGASGCGKDALLRALRARAVPGLVIAHRYITRPVEAIGENHIALHVHEFTQRRLAGCFALYWPAHDQHYAVGIEVRQWLAQGLHVVMNGSRAHLAQALEAFGKQLVPVLIEVDPASLAQRLQARGRETAEEIARRLQRCPPPLPGDALLRLANNGPLDETLDQLCQIVARYPLNTSALGPAQIEMTESLITAERILC